MYISRADANYRPHPDGVPGKLEMRMAQNEADLAGIEDDPLLRAYQLFKLPQNPYGEGRQSAAAGR